MFTRSKRTQPKRLRPFRTGPADLGVQQAAARAMVQAIKLACIVAAAALIIVGGMKTFAYTRQSAADSEGIGQSVTITISKKDDDTAVAHKLHKAGLIHSELYFKSVLKLKSAVVVPGTYSLIKGLSVGEIVRIITR